MICSPINKGAPYLDDSKKKIIEDQKRDHDESLEALRSLVKASCQKITQNVIVHRMLEQVVQILLKIKINESLAGVEIEQYETTM